MTFAAINWLSISIDLLLVIFVIVCLLMILLILMQRPKQEGLGAAFGGGVTDQVFGARTTNVLQRGTVYLGSLFFILSLALAVLIGQKNKTISTVTEADTAIKVEAAKPESRPGSRHSEIPSGRTSTGRSDPCRNSSTGGCPCGRSHGCHSRTGSRTCGSCRDLTTCRGDSSGRRSCRPRSG